MEHTRRGERLQYDIVERNRCADPHAQTTERAVDVLDRERPGRNAAESVDHCPRDIHRVDLRSRPDESSRRLDEPLIAELVVVTDIAVHADAARVKGLTRHSVVGVRHVVLKKSPANLAVDQQTSFAGGKIEPGKWDLQAVAKAGRRIEPG